MKFIIKPYGEDGDVAVYQINFNDKQHLATINLTRGKAIYGERLVEDDSREYRLWDPYKSKLAAAIMKGLIKIPVRLGCSVLYLGAAAGTTVSHISDMVSVGGRVYAVEFSPRSLRELVNNLSDRGNVFPILADARSPRSYMFMVEKVDVVYSDIAQPEQARIVADNVEVFLRDGGSVLFVIKARSVNSVDDPANVFEREIDVLKRRGLKVINIIPLEPYDKDHVMVLAEWTKRLF